jgi:putative DNA primase/helicase
MNSDMPDSVAATNLVNLQDHKRGGRGGGGVPSELRDLPLSDVWMGKWFAHQWRQTTRYSYEEKDWLIYQDGHWKFDNTGERDRRLLASIESVRRASPSEALVAGKSAEQLNDFYVRSLSSKAIAAAEVRTRSECACTVDQFDVDPLLLNVANGTIDLRTGQLRPAAAEDMLMKQSPVVYDAEAVPTEWCAAVDQWFAGDRQMVSYLRRITALFLTGDVQERAFFLLYGSGRNGKGTYVSTIESLLGPDYSFAIPVEYFLRTRNPRMEIDVHAARGKRLIVIGETESGADLNAAKIKHWSSGGDTMTGKALFEHLSNYQPTHKLLLQTNHEPRFNDRSEGFADRLKKIPFTVKIDDSAMKLGLKDHLRENELPGILNWALGALAGEERECGYVAGLEDWRTNRLNTPESVKKATREMLDSQDELRLWFEEGGVELGAGFELSRDEGYLSYRNWCDSNRVRRPLGKNQFIAAMREQPDVKESVSGSRKWRGWSGLRMGSSSGETAARRSCNKCALPAVADGRCEKHALGYESRQEDLL